MPHAQHLLTNWTAGEISPRLHTRPDITKYKNGARVVENFTILPHGGARKRPAFKYIMGQRSDSSDVVLVPFQYNTEQAYVLAFGANYIWFYKDQGLITFTGTAITGATNASPGVVTAVAHGLSNGQYVTITGVVGMHQINNRVFQVAGVTANTFQLSGVNTTAYGAYSSGGTVAAVVELATTYTQGELNDLRYCQSADTMYVVHGSHRPAKITRSSHTSWSVADLTINNGPFRNINADRNVRLTPSGFSSGATGFGTHQVGETFTLTATGGAPFAAGMVGGLFRLNEEGGVTGITAANLATTQAIVNGDLYTNEGSVYGVNSVTGTANWAPFGRVPSHTSGIVRVYGGSGTGVYFDANFLHPGFCVVQVIGFTSTTVVTCAIVFYQMPASIVASGTSFWEEGAWSPYRGFPACICFYENRLMLAGSGYSPQTVWGSRTGAFEDFQDGADDDHSLNLSLTSSKSDILRWIVGARALLCGSSSAEFAITSTQRAETLTPSNAHATVQTTYGVSKGQVLQIGQTVLYPQRAGSPNNPAHKLREFAYDFQGDKFESTDLGIFAEHIAAVGFDHVTHAIDPDDVIWLRRADGTLAGVTYERAQEVIAWHRHVLGGSNCRLISATVIPGVDGDELWASLSRTSAATGQTVRYIAVMQPPLVETDFSADVKNRAYYLDNMMTYAGPSTSTITGLWPMEGETVDVLNNGNVERGKVVTNGAITLTVPSSAAAGARVHVGHRYRSILETTDLEAAAAGGTAQAKPKRIAALFLSLFRSLGGTVGPDAAHQDEIVYRTPDMAMDSSPSLKTGYVQIGFPSNWDREARIRIEHDDPLPFFVRGIMAELSTTG
jgi:hypothetical protein